MNDPWIILLVMWAVTFHQTGMHYYQLMWHWRTEVITCGVEEKLVWLVLTSVKIKLHPIIYCRLCFLGVACIQLILAYCMLMNCEFLLLLCRSIPLARLSAFINTHAQPPTSFTYFTPVHSYTPPQPPACPHAYAHTFPKLQQTYRSVTTSDDRIF